MSKIQCGNQRSNGSRKKLLTYNGELILQPEQRLTLQQKWELLDWHPMFTGRCPECEMPISAPNDGIQWDYLSCSWRDDSND